MQPESNPNSAEELKPNESMNNNVVPSQPTFLTTDNVPVASGEQETEPSSFLLATAETANLDKAIKCELEHGRKLNPRIDTKKLRRSISNRLSAKRYRVKKARYINGMEKKVVALEEWIISLARRFKKMQEERRLLKMENEALEQMLEIRRNEANRLQLMLEKQQEELIRLDEEKKELLRKAIAELINAN